MSAMSIFDAAKELGLFPSGLILGLVLGLCWEAIRLIRAALPHPAPVIFIQDMLGVMVFWLALFSFCVGTLGRIRYHIAVAMLLGVLAERFTTGRILMGVLGAPLGLFRDKVLAALIGYIAKSLKKAGGVFVRVTKNSKNLKKPLKVES